MPSNSDPWCSGLSKSTKSLRSTKSIHGGRAKEGSVVAPLPQAWNPCALGLLCVWVWVRADTPGLWDFLRLLEVLDVCVLSWGSQSLSVVLFLGTLRTVTHMRLLGLERGPQFVRC